MVRSTSIKMITHIILAISYLALLIISAGLFAPYISIIFFLVMLAISISYLIGLEFQRVIIILDAISALYLIVGAVYYGSYALYFVFLVQVVALAAFVYFSRSKETGKKGNTGPSPMDLPVYG